MAFYFVAQTVHMECFVEPLMRCLDGPSIVRLGMTTRSINYSVRRAASHLTFHELEIDTTAPFASLANLAKTFLSVKSIKILGIRDMLDELSQSKSLYQKISAPFFGFWHLQSLKATRLSGRAFLEICAATMDLVDASEREGTIAFPALQNLKIDTWHYECYQEVGKKRRTLDAAMTQKHLPALMSIDSPILFVTPNYERLTRIKTFISDGTIWNILVYNAPNILDIELEGNAEASPIVVNADVYPPSLTRLKLTKIIFATATELPQYLVTLDVTCPALEPSPFFLARRLPKTLCFLTANSGKMIDCITRELDHTNAYDWSRDHLPPRLGVALATTNRPNLQKLAKCAHEHAAIAYFWSYLCAQEPEGDGLNASSLQSDPSILLAILQALIDQPYTVDMSRICHLLHLLNGERGCECVKCTDEFAIKDLLGRMVFEGRLQKSNRKPYSCTTGSPRELSRHNLQDFARHLWPKLTFFGNNFVSSSGICRRLSVRIWPKERLPVVPHGVHAVAISAFGTKVGVKKFASYLESLPSSVKSLELTLPSQVLNWHIAKSIPASTRHLSLSFDGGPVSDYKIGIFLLWFLLPKKLRRLDLYINTSFNDMFWLNVFEKCQRWLAFWRRPVILHTSALTMVPNSTLPYVSYAILLLSVWLLAPWDVLGTFFKILLTFIVVGFGSIWMVSSF